MNKILKKAICTVLAISYLLACYFGGVKLGEVLTEMVNE